MVYTYPSPYESRKTGKTIKQTDGVYRPETRRDVVKAAIAKGLATAEREDKLSRRAFLRKMRHLTEQASKTTDGERAAWLDWHFWRHLAIYTKDGVTWLEHKPIRCEIKTRGGWSVEYDHLQAQPIRLRDWWVRQLT